MAVLITVAGILLVGLLTTIYIWQAREHILEPWVAISLPPALVAMALLFCLPTVVITSTIIKHRNTNPSNTNN